MIDCRFKNTKLIIGEKLLPLQNFIFEPFLQPVCSVKVDRPKTVITFNDRWILGPPSFQSSNGEV